ncbi:MAG: glycerol-3-phosphate dehydrogenase/oxidase [Egibacteraceae bacterium]
MPVGQSPRATTPVFSRYSASLNAARRERELGELVAGQVVDLLVVGLGVTGAGVALDAASRGLSVAAVDAHDLAFGTSRWSSKLVHGGLRYLARGQVDVAYESAVERGILLRHTAPHLVRPLSFLFPLTAAVSRRQGALVAAGFRAGDILRAAARTSARALPRSKRLSRAEALRRAPMLRLAGLRGGLVSWDGQLEDDVRLVVALARTAASYGARVLTRIRVEALDGDGATVTDVPTGERFMVRARAVVNATGVWAGTLVPGITLRPSRGTHIVLRAETLGGLRDVALTLLVPGTTNRFLFALPQPDGLVFVGVTDEPVTGCVPEVLEPPETDITFLLDIVSSVLQTPLRRSDVVGAFAGLRPLLSRAGAEGRTADLSRRHAVLTSTSGVVTVVGGKLTTYRRMAQDAVDAAVRPRGLTGAPCRTAHLPLVGAAAPADLLALAAPARLIRRYGTEAPLVAAVGGDPAMLDPVAPGLAVTGAELLWGVLHEGALDVDDLLDRRARLGLVPADREAALPAARAVLERAAQLS